MEKDDKKVNATSCRRETSTLVSDEVGWQLNSSLQESSSPSEGSVAPGYGFPACSCYQVDITNQ